MDPLTLGAAHGFAWGGLLDTLAGLLLLNPLAGLAAGLAPGDGGASSSNGWRASWRPSAPASPAHR